MSYETLFVTGWFLICERRTEGTHPGDATCPKDIEHNASGFGSVKFCPQCGSKLNFPEEPHQRSFVDVYEREEYLGDELCQKLENDFWHIPISSGTHDFIEPTFEGLFGIGGKGYEDEDGDTFEDIIVCDPNTIPVDFDRQREVIKERIKVLEPLYSNIEIHFGSIEVVV